MEIDFKFIQEFILVIKNAYDEAMKISNKNIKNKELNDIVTDIDIFMEDKIVKAIKDRFPNHSIYAEESGEVNNNSEYEWLIDPIDGTINFASDIPLFATSVALRKNGDIVLGIIIDYSQDDVYYCIKGQGAFCNGKHINVSKNNKLNNSIISFCLTSHYNDKHIKEVLKIEEKLASKVRGLRLIVSTAIELAWLASGKIDGCLNVKPSIGLRENIDTMLVTNGNIHKEIVSVINE